MNLDSPYKSARTRSQLLVLMLALALLPIVTVLLNMTQLLGLLFRMDSVSTDAEAEAWINEMNRFGSNFPAIALRQQFAQVVAAAAWFIWQHRFVASLLALGLDLETTPGNSIGRWFVPVLNFVTPFQLFARIDALLGCGARILIRWWWALFLIGAIGPNVYSLAIDRVDDSALSAVIASAVAVQISLAIAAVLAIFVVRRLQAAADERSEQPPPAVSA
jgi:uncharacterized protein DUF4328